MYSKIEKELIELIGNKLYPVKIQRNSLYTDDEVRSNIDPHLTDYVDVSWSIGDIAKTAVDGNRVVFNNRKDIKQSIKDMFRIIDLAKLSSKVPENILEYTKYLPKYLDIIKESQSYIFKYATEEMYGKEDAKTSKDIGNIIRLIKGKDSDEVREYSGKTVHKDSPHSRVTDKDIKSNGKLFNRLYKTYQDKAYGEVKNRVLLEEYSSQEYYSTIGITDKEEFLMYYDIDNSCTELDYDNLRNRKHLLKFLTYNEIGKIMRDKNVFIDINNDSIIRANYNKRRLEFKDEVFGWYPILEEELIIKAILLYKVDLNKLDISEYIKGHING